MIGAPIIDAIHRALSHLMPALSDRVSWPLADKIFAVTLTIMIFYIVGWAAQRVFGRRLIEALEGVLGCVPLVKTIYGGIRKLIGTLEGQSTGGQRVVLISFPSEEMKTIGLLTRLITEDSTGRTLAIVYVPTTPNPISGYVEIIPAERVVATDWTIDEAMSFIMSAGAVVPGRSIKYTADLRPASSSLHLPGTATIGS
jgi:uncharacterized membrane protein